MQDPEQPINDAPIAWKEFLDEFAAQYAHPTEAGIALDLTSEELEALGEFFVQGLVGWSLGIQMARRLPRRLMEITPAPPAEEEPAAEESGKPQDRQGRKRWR